MKQIQVQLPDTDSVVDAELSFTDKEYVVRLAPYEFLGELSQVEIHKTKNSISYGLGNPRGISKDYRPRTYWAYIEGQPATLLDARASVAHEGNSLMGGLQQILAGRRLVYGAHLDSDEHPVNGVRFALDIKRRPGWGSTEPADFSGGSLLLREHGEGLVGIEAMLDETKSVWDASNRLAAPIRTLFALWLWRNVEHGHIEVHEPAHGWLPLHEFSPLHVEKNTISKFFHLAYLTPSLMARWFDLSGKLGPIPYMAADRISVLQTNALVKSTALEGCHRRLFRAPDRMNYRPRVTELAKNLEDLVPGLFGPDLSKWSKEMRVMRDEQSHVFTDVDDFGDAHITRYFVMATSADWTLRLTLLLQVADREMVARELRECNRLHMALANMDNPGFWEGFSHYDTFWDHSKTALD